jgi:3-oxoacyl-[acyl-carrier-protein] synthase-3
MTNNSKIESIGAVYPEKSLTTETLLKRLNIKRKPRLELLTGIHSRRICDENEDSLTLAVNAAKSCLNHSKYNALEIEMIINCSISRYVNGTQYYFEPSLSLMIKKAIGNKNALVFDISNACAGMLTGASVANEFISQGVVKNCLVVSGEFISNIADHAVKSIDSSSHAEMASLTVGDAGAAVIFDASNNKSAAIDIISMQTLSEHSALCMGYQSTDSPGAFMCTDMKSIHEISLERSPDIIKNTLKEAGLTYADINYVIPHQTAKRSIRCGEKILQKFFNASPTVIENLYEFGNTASTTHFTTLYKHLIKGTFRAQDKIMLLSFASGLIIGSMIFTVNDLILNYEY